MIASASSRNPQVGAVVIGGSYRALGVVRSLGRHGVPIWVLTDEHTLAAHSRYATIKREWPASDPDEQLASIRNLAEHEGLTGWTIFPTDDESAVLLSRHHADLSPMFRLTVPPWDILRWSYDKRLTYQIAADLGIAYPLTVCSPSRASLENEDFDFPVILKPAFKEHLNAFTYAKAWRVDSRTELLLRYDLASQFADPDAIMVQEIVPASLDGQLSFAALCVDGRVIASMVARRTRQHPLDFGRSSTLVETVEQPLIEEPSRALLAEMRFTGLVEIEFKRDPRDGRFKLLDINPRIWGWHTLGNRAGVDFSYLQWLLVNGESIPEARARLGVRWVRGATDFCAVVTGIRTGRFALRDYLRSMKPPIEFAIFAVDDPLPAIVELPLLAGVALKRYLSLWHKPSIRGQHGADYAGSSG